MILKKYSDLSSFILPNSDILLEHLKIIVKDFNNISNNNKLLNEATAEINSFLPELKLNSTNTSLFLEKIEEIISFCKTHPIPKDDYFEEINFFDLFDSLVKTQEKINFLQDSFFVISDKDLPKNLIEIKNMILVLITNNNKQI